ncbi:hypothetical protein [Saccharicrinis aurantiacus]|uniref:hypothetical protein n=1 Tax=Saccharicrinis aurantiacus TaxID=1849719 RepID=UPI002491244A|nr:hypothetical protein [Saccharicrinis aurantiacus]
MKKFAINIPRFIIAPLIFVCTLIMITRYQAQKITVGNSTQIIIAGDSHTETGLNDEIIKNSLNIAQSSELFIYTYSKIKAIINNNPQINKVILGVSFHSFAKEYDRFLENPDRTKGMFPRYFTVMDINSCLDIPQITLNGAYKIIRSLIDFPFSANSIQEYSFIGKYYKSSKNNLNDSTINIAIQRHYFYPDYNKETSLYSDYQQKYLINIVEYCENNNIDLVLVNTPISPGYMERIPKNYISNYYSLINTIKDKVHFYDFHALEMPQECYGDGDHLNSKGAEKLSLIFNKIMNAPLQL